MGQKFHFEQFGFVNAGIRNRRPEGDESWFRTREERNEALAEFRTRAIADGLSDVAAQGSIYPIEGQRKIFDSWGED